MWNQYLLMYFFILSVYAWTKKEYFKLEWFPTNKLWRPKDKVSNPVWYPFSKLDAHRNVWEKISQSLPTKDANSATWYGGDNHCTMGNHNCDKCPKIKLISTWYSALKLEKKCNFKSTKTHFLLFQKWPKINFLWTGKKF